jgi:hypothetical protein
MVEPVGFGANPETAHDNAFQKPVPAAEEPSVEARAHAEFHALKEALESRGVEVVVFPPGADPPPDAVFPNNWFSTQPGMPWVLYPLMAPSRRRERSPAIVAWLRDRYGEPIDLTAEEARGRFLEGTGSLVIDAIAGVVYASRSSRTDRELVEAWAARMGYRPLVFTTRDRDGRTVYHTNVVLTLGTGYAIACLEAIEHEEARVEVTAELERSGREIVAIGLDQLHAFCANALELEGAGGKRLLVMSERAWRALVPAQRAALDARAEIVRVDLETIETYGGGSARCMLAELY